ncbi:AraC family transcriptional regulator [Flavobacterium sp. ENC]|uniref:helix-turn-helix domain-containing protein n=1 Tax=Flavobacterium sp. ENC TaxID=2897330 RepID=UPI001E417AC9|nr:AraC family transcriptional regulator [Flavobacterium sp. ENC]MCD0467110.1 AraC family transcriptional regulator [Flavobacterium sp. ENC]
MKKINHFYSLTPDWQQQLVQEINGELIDDKIIIIPENLGKGHSYFTPIAAGISALFVDFVVTEPVEINRLKSDNESYIFHFDLSDSVNFIKIDAADYKIGSRENPGLAIIDNQTESSFKPSVNERTLALRLLVDKKLLNELLETTAIGEFQKQENKLEQKSLYYYDNIDSNSVLLIRSLMDKSVFDLSFDSYLKGISLKLLGNFLNRYENLSVKKNEIKETDLEAVIKTQDYFLKDLCNPFPTINFLSEMAGMSSTKYKILFKKHFNDSPKKLFLKEKMILAHKLLQSGKYSTLIEIVYELSYTRMNHFHSKYYAVFKRKPSEDFVKKPYRKMSQRAPQIVT